MRIVPYTPEHHDEMRAVCLATASERARTDPAHGEFTLLMYCEPYLEHGIAFMLLDDDDVVRGYTLGCEDWAAWKPLFEPYAERIRRISTEHAERMAGELDDFERVADDYPAHLHIDIQEDYTGGGNGRALMEAMITHLRRAGVAGVAFGVAPGNARAIGFYEHMGFEHLPQYEQDAPVFGMRF
jgi:GNAT superfamily N-acetyltransferase